MTNCTRSRSPPAAPTASSKHRANLHLQERVSQRTSQENGQKLVSKSSVEPDHHSDTIIKHDIQAYFKHVYVRESQLNSARQQCWLDWSVCVCLCVYTDLYHRMCGRGSSSPWPHRELPQEHSGNEGGWRSCLTE